MGRRGLRRGRRGGGRHAPGQRRAPGIAAVEFGFDLENLYVRVDGTIPVAEMLAAGFGLSLRFLSPVGLRVGPRSGRTERSSRSLYRKRRRGLVEASRSLGCVRRSDASPSSQIPFAVLGAATGDRVAMFVMLTPRRRARSTASHAIRPSSSRCRTSDSRAGPGRPDLGQTPQSPSTNHQQAGISRPFPQRRIRHVM